jgi:DNA repair protein RecO (recombination protein O)
LALATGSRLPDNDQRAARDFMRRLIDQHLDGREIQTRRLL